jgi:hypothetical protein
VIEEHRQHRQSPQTVEPGEVAETRYTRGLLSPAMGPVLPSARKRQAGGRGGLALAGSHFEPSR